MKKNKSWPYGLTIFYVLLVLTVVGFCFWSGFHRVDLVTKDYYADEIAYQDRIDSMQRTSRLERPPTIQYEGDEVRISFAAPPDSGETFFYRPSDASLDRKHPIELNADGAQVFDAASLRAGLWKVQLTWIQDGQEYYMEETLILN